MENTKTKEKFIMKKNRNTMSLNVCKYLIHEKEKTPYRDEECGLNFFVFTDTETKTFR